MPSLAAAAAAAPMVQGQAAVKAIKRQGANSLIPWRKILKQVPV